MKYPEAVYRIGNEFRYKIRVVGLIFCEMANDSIIEFTNGDLYEKKEATLTGITAETLAELARENREEVRLDFEIEWSHQINTYKFYKSGGLRGSWRFRINKDEPIGEFFLRVAKERKYIS